MEHERCLRCASTMEWRHGTWQCARCRFKLGCCEGEPTSPDGSGSCRAEPGSATSPRRREPYSAVETVSSGESSRSR